LLDDGSEVRAPIAGLVAGLLAAQHELAVAVPVDVPLLAAADLRGLADSCAGADAAFPPSGPLPGAYRRSALPVLERALAEGRLALREAARELDVRPVALPPERLANVNEPADLDRLERPEIVPLAARHADHFRRFVVTSLAEQGLAPDPGLDPDLADPHTSYAAAWVIEAGAGIAGSVVLIEAGPGELVLRRMHLTPGLRGRGTGRRLLEHALAWAREHGHRRVLLDTTEGMDTAQRLYESVGFRRVDERRRQGRPLYDYRLDL
jgi:GNAT superfamily N-acetyltransferase